MDGLANLLGMDTQLLNWIITGIFTFLFGLGATWILRLQDEVKTSREERQTEIEKIRSDIRIKEEAQKADNEQIIKLMELMSKQIEVGNKTADIIQAAESRRSEQEAKRHELIREFTSEQSKTTDAVELLSAQVGAVNAGVMLTQNDAKAATLMGIETNKNVQSLGSAIQQQTTLLRSVRDEVIAGLDKVIKQPIAEEIRTALREVEKNLLQAIDKIELNPTIVIEEKKHDDQIAQPFGDSAAIKPS